MNNKKKFSPKTTIFLWDLHEVILQKSLWDWFKICAQFTRKYELIRHIDKHSARIALTFALERVALLKKQLISEELIQAAHEAKNDALVDLTIATCSSYTPIAETVTLMQELTALGYKHHLGSNIGKTVFNACSDKFAHIFNLFDAHTIPFYADNDDVIKKPNPHFFHAHLHNHNLLAENIIFIDDKKTNILAARSVGIHAIQFKNAQQLRKDLHHMDIFI